MSEKLPDQAIDLFKYKLDTQMERGINLEKRSFTVTGVVDKDMFHRVDGCLSIFEGQGDEPITITLCSEGGEVYSALAIIGRIKSSPCKITIIAMGQIMSAATIIFASADKRIASRYTSFMFHQVQAGIPEGSTSYVKDELVEAERQTEIMCDVLAEGSKFTSENWEQLISGGRNVYRTAAQCKELGLVHKII